MKRMILSALLTLSSIGSAAAAELPAAHCELFIKEVGLSWQSHGGSGMVATLRVGALPPGETVVRVGWYGERKVRQLNPRETHGEERPWRIEEGFAAGNGEYRFGFPIHLSSRAEFTSIGAFFLQTDRNTYWLNPDLRAGRNFYFDPNAFTLLPRVGGSDHVRTDREDMRYYNPLACR